jgi:vacuolar-type H+-ATPase subunit E/Vma4
MENATTSLDALRREIMQRSEQDAAAILGEAERDAAKLVADTRAGAEAARAEVLKRAAGQAESTKKRILSGVHLETQKRRLQLTEETLARIFERVRERFEVFRTDKGYDVFLGGLVLEGALALDSDEVHVVPGDIERKFLSKDRLAAIEKEAAKAGRTVRLALSTESLREGGAVLISADGRTRFDNGFSARLRRNQNAMRLEAMKILG